MYSIQDYEINFVRDLRQVRGFLRVSSTNKTDRHDITEILSKHTPHTSQNEGIPTVVKELRSKLFCHLPVQVNQGMFDIQATTKSKYYDHIVLLYLESRRCRYRSIIFVCFYLYVSVVNLIDYSDIDKMMDINNEKC